MRILHVIDSLGVGGAERLIVDFIKQYQASFPEDDHYIVTLYNDTNTLLHEIEEYIVEHTCLFFKPLLFWNSVFLLRGKLKRWKIDVIHSHLFYATIVTRLARYSSKHIRMVTTYHNMEYCIESPAYSWKFPLIDKLTVPFHNYHAVFVSNAVAKCVTNCIRKITDFSILYNFAAKKFYSTYKYNNRNEIRLVAVGNLKAVKNYFYALEELKLLGEERVSLDIYGKGEEYTDLKSFIAQNCLHVQLKGDVEITSELLSNYDAFLMTSISEGMPVSLIEAIVTGLPSMVTDLPQLRETAKDAAIYFPLQRGALCHMIKQLLNEKQRLKHIADNTDKIKSNFAIEEYIKSVRTIYCSYL